MLGQFPEGWGLLQQAARDLPEQGGSGQESHYFENPGTRANDWHYFIKESTTGEMSLEASCHDAEDGHFDGTDTIIFDDRRILREAMAHLTQQGEYVAVGKGRARKFYDYQQVGSAWDSEETVASGYGDKTTEGTITCHLKLLNGFLEKFEYKVEE